jgi:hypothetical protein
MQIQTTDISTNSKTDNRNIDCLADSLTSPMDGLATIPLALINDPASDTTGR